MSAKLEELRARFAAHQEALARHSQWVPHKPWPKQLAFMELEELEALYGGAAGGGKTDALLAAALQYVDEPRYSALLLRRSTTDLKLPGALMDRSHSWLDSTAARWHAQDKQWTFPSGATIQFGYCQSELDVQRYKSAEFQFIGIDELTEWPERWYTYLFSRLRRLKSSRVPPRMRAATNPDGPGYGWVRDRFGIPENEVITEPIRGPEGTLFYPARAEDNPSIDLEAYELALERMLGGRGGVKWKQLRSGIWIPDGAGLVYVFNRSRNTAPENIPAWRKERARWHFILGVDYGFTNACGFAVIGWRDNDPHVYVLEAFTVQELDTTAAAEVVKGLEVIYAFEKIVGDVGGLGKVYVEEARRRHIIPVEPAQKQNKRGYQVLFNDALGRGHVLLVEATTKDLRDEWSRLPWDPERKAELKGFANHAADATLYAWREAPNYHERAAAEKPKPGTKEHAEAEEKRMEEAVDEELENDERAARDRARGNYWR